MHKLIYCVALCTFSFFVNAQTKDDIAIADMLQTQTAAWNMGDINAFMEPYWKSDSLMFIGKNGPTYGWEQTKANYIKSYPDTAYMGKLTFDIISTKRLSAIYYSVVGKWHLKRSVGDVGGAFTLLLRKIKNKWVIIQDHSS
jgi:hypothetical protein